MGKRSLWLAVALLLLASVAWCRGQRTITIKPQPTTRKGDAVVLRHIKLVVDHREKGNPVYMRLEDVATLMQRSITYTVDEDGTPTGQITVQPAPKGR